MDMIGDTRLNEEEIRKTHLKPYIAAVKKGTKYYD